MNVDMRGASAVKTITGFEYKIDVPSSGPWLGGQSHHLALQLVTSLDQTHPNAALLGSAKQVHPLGCRVIHASSSVVS